MARLVTKFKYLKPNKKAKGGYARYIATRDGVEKIDDSQIHEPATPKQRKLIDKISKEFPEVKSMLEYEDYTAKPTVGNASELISRALEDAAGSILDEKTYADYIATRPRAQRFGAHGLFTDDGTLSDAKTQSVWSMIRENDGAICCALMQMNSRHSFIYRDKSSGGLPRFTTKATILISI